MQNSKLLKTAGLVLAFAAVAVMSGCNEPVQAEKVTIPRKIYEKADYVTAMVNKGDMKPVLTLKLEAQIADQVKYSVDITDAEVDEVFVSLGDHVEAGQLLCSFKSDKTKKEIENYKAELEEKQLMLDHFTRLSLFELQPREYTLKEKKEYPLYQQQEDEINKNRDKEDKRRKAIDYDLTISQLQSDVNLAAAYLEEAEARLERCQIRAKEDGVISFISTGLLSGYVEPGAMVITETIGESSYVAYTIDDYDFRVGDTYEAEDESMSYDLTVTEVTEESSGTRKIVFAPAATLLDPPDGDSMIMTIQKTQLKDVIYVNSKAINKNKEDNKIVFVVSDSGFLDARVVELGETVDDMVVIRKGLDGNEKVAILK